VAIFSGTGALTGEFVFPWKRKRWVEKYDANIAGNGGLSSIKCLKNRVLRAEIAGNIEVVMFCGPSLKQIDLCSKYGYVQYK
jgi:hypothetical protein